MNSSLPGLSVNLLPPDKLYCNFSYWSSLFSQDMQILWDRAHGVPLEKLPKGLSDMIFPYLLLALSDYKTSQINKMNLGFEMSKNNFNMRISYKYKLKLTHSVSLSNTLLSVIFIHHFLKF